MTSVWPLKCESVSLLCWLKQFECSVHFTINNIYHFYTSDVFCTDVYYLTFVVHKMYQWQVRNDFNKDVYDKKVNKTNKLVPVVPHANWHHLTVRQPEHTKYSIYQQQCNGSKCSLWGMKMTTLPKLVQFSFIPISASAIGCRSSGSCSSTGLCAGLMITGLKFQLLPTLPPSDTECQLQAWGQIHICIWFLHESVFEW